MLGVSVAVAGSLLLKFRWDKELLLERYYEDTDRVLRDAGETPPCPREARATASPRAHSPRRPPQG